MCMFILKLEKKESFIISLYFFLFSLSSNVFLVALCATSICFPVAILLFVYVPSSCMLWVSDLQSGPILKLDVRRNWKIFVSVLIYKFCRWQNNYFCCLYVSGGLKVFWNLHMHFDAGTYFVPWRIFDLEV